MSYCAIVSFTNNIATHTQKFSNAWGGAAFVWEALFDRYIKDPSIPYHNWMSMDECKKIWALADRHDILEWEREVLGGTFDYAVIYRENLAKYTVSLRRFHKEYAKADSVCHLLGWAEYIEAHPEFQAVAFIGTSVSCCGHWIMEDTEGVEWPYNLTIGTKHFDVYDSLYGADARQAQ